MTTTDTASPGPRLSPSMWAVSSGGLRPPRAVTVDSSGCRGQQGRRALAGQPRCCAHLSREVRLDSALPNKPFPKLHLGEVSCAGYGLDLLFKGESRCSCVFSLVRPLTWPCGDFWTTGASQNPGLTDTGSPSDSYRCMHSTAAPGDAWFGWRVGRRSPV